MAAERVGQSYSTWSRMVVLEAAERVLNPQEEET
jgi:hypothetical protein